MNIIVSTPSYGPKTLVWVNASPTADTNFLTLLNGAGSTSSSTMEAGQQMEIRFNVTAVPKDTKINIEMRPGVGAALPFTKTTPPAITANNVLY
jgi:archaellin